MNQPTRIATAAAIRFGEVAVIVVVLVASIEAATWVQMWLDARRNG